MSEDVIEGYVVAINEKAHTGIKIAENQDAPGEWYNGKPDLLMICQRGDHVRLVVAGKSIKGIKKLEQAEIKEQTISRDELILREVAAKCASTLLAGKFVSNEEWMIKAEEILDWIKGE
jgi:hypothetical protein